MNNVNPANVKKSAIMFFIASVCFDIGFVVSMLGDSPNGYLAIPGALMLGAGFFQWKNYKKLKKNNQ